MKLNVAIISLIFGLFSGLYAMEEERPNQKIINIRIAENEVVNLPEDIALHSSLIRTYLEDNNIHDNSPEIDLSNVILQRRNNKKESLSLTSNAVQTAFDATIHGKKTLHNLTISQLIHVFHIGEYFGIPQKTMRKLTRYIQKNISEHDEELGENEQLELLKNPHHCNSISSLVCDNALNVELVQIINGLCEDNEFPRYSLDLSDQKLDSLAGIEKLAKKYEKVRIHEINLSHNRLQILDVERIIAAFPFLRCIKANKNMNGIETIILPKELPKSFYLQAHSNHLVDIPNFKIKRGYIDLRNNPLSLSTKKKLEALASPSILENAIVTPFYNQYFYQVNLPEFIRSLKNGGVGGLTTLLSMYGSELLFRQNMPHTYIFKFAAMSGIAGIAIELAVQRKDHYKKLYDLHDCVYETSHPIIKYDAEKKYLKFSHFFDQQDHLYQNFKPNSLPSIWKL